MSTIFIALQCCQCSTMQVKQQKKSSNKWICVVCNQKQSVRKVFAQGFMARDVRKFVQSFNMSRQFAEQCADETLVPISEEINSQLDSINRNNKKKRTDWSEYIDPEDDRIEEEQGDVFEPKIVTELPNALFKKPKLDKKFTRVDSNDDGNKPLRPVFSKKNSNKSIIAQVHLARKFQPSTAKAASKWSDENHRRADKQLQREKPITVKLTSKWDDYIREDDDDLELKNGGDYTEHTGHWDNVECETTLNDQRVEEDIHPDFM